MRVQCCICSDLLVNESEANITATACGHVFHKHCLAQWLNSSQTCPSCRKAVNNSTIIPKLYFDVVDGDDFNLADPDQSSKELQMLKSRLAGLQQEKWASEAKAQELKDQVGQKNEALEAVQAVLQQEQYRSAAQQRMLQQYEAQAQVHKEQKAEFLRAQLKLTELKHIEIILSGDCNECEDILQLFVGSKSGNPGQQQMAKYLSILKKEYEQAKTEKLQLRKQLDKLKSQCHSNTQAVAQLRQQKQSLEEHLARSEDDLKQAEKMITSLKAKLHKLKYSRSCHKGQSAGSISETPEPQESALFAFPITPKLPAPVDMSGDTSDGVLVIRRHRELSFARRNISEMPKPQESAICASPITPKLPAPVDMSDDTSDGVLVIRRYREHRFARRSISETPEPKESALFASPITPKLPAPVDMSDDTSDGVLLIRQHKESSFARRSNRSFDLFEESPRTQVRKACKENNQRVVKISSATASCKRAKVEAEDVASYVPLTALNIMKKREKTGQLMNTTVIRKDYDGLGSTSSFTQPLGLPRLSSCLNKNKKQKKIRCTRVPIKPSLPTLDAYIDLTD